MNYSRKYSRNFIALKQDNPKYNLDFRPSIGRCLVEIKDNVGKITIYAQGIKPKIDYNIELLGFSKGELKNAPLGSFSVDEYGKGEFKKDFNPDNVLDNGNKIEDYNIVALMVDDGDSSSALVGYVGSEVAWKDAYKNVVSKSKDCPCETNPDNNKPNDNTPNNNTPNTNKPDNNKPNNKPNDNIPNNKPNDNKPDNNTPNNNKPDNNKPNTNKPNDNMPNNNKPNDKPNDKPNNNTPDTPTPDDAPLDGIANEIEKGLIEKEEGLLKREKGLIEREKSIVQKEQFGNKLSLVDFEMSLLDKEKGLIEKEKGLIEKEEGLLEKKTAIEKGFLPIDDEKLRIKERELMSMEEILINKEEELILREKHTIRKNPKSDKERGLIEKEKGLLEKELGLIEREKGLLDTEKGLLAIEDDILEKRKNTNDTPNNDDNINTTNLKTKNVTINSDIQYIKHYNAKMTPFNHYDNNIDWHRISPYDLMCLPKEYYKYSNNTFVYASYRKYKHLLLGIHCVDGNERYILAVPCKYDNNFTATGELSHFDEFVPINKDDKGSDIYGYRLMHIL